MTVIECFLKQSDAYPEKTAVIFENKYISYRELKESVCKTAGFLRDNGVEKGAKIILSLSNSPEFLYFMLAAADIGAVIVPLSITLSEKALAAAIKSSDASFAVVERGNASKVFNLLDNKSIFIVSDKLPADNSELLFNLPDIDTHYALGKNEIEPDIDYILTMTSGSTGNPKPIIFSQKNKVLRGIDACAELYGVTEEDVIITASPMYHSLGQRLALFPLMIGASTVILKKFMPELWLEAVEKYKISFTIAVSSHLESILRKLKQGNYNISSLKTIVSSSSLLKNDAKLECLKYFNCDFHECYGTSEVGIVTNLYPKDANIKLKSVGVPLPFVDMKIVDDNANQVSVGEVGEIICSTPTLFSGYYKLPEKTLESVVDGYFFTGDLGKVDKDGYLYFCGRKKELIIVGGTNVYPGDIEEIINACSEVSECAVIGVDDSYFGEAVLAIIVPVKGIEPKKALRSARKACAGALADYQQPMAYETLESLPKNALGKLMKHKLCEQFIGYDATAKFRALRGIK